MLVELDASLSGPRAAEGGHPAALACGLEALSADPSLTWHALSVTRRAPDGTTATDTHAACGWPAPALRAADVAAFTLHGRSALGGGAVFVSVALLPAAEGSGGGAPRARFTCAPAGLTSVALEWPLQPGAGPHAAQALTAALQIAWHAGAARVKK